MILIYHLVNELSNIYNSRACGNPELSGTIVKNIIFYLNHFCRYLLDCGSGAGMTKQKNLASSAKFFYPKNPKHLNNPKHPSPIPHNLPAPVSPCIRYRPGSGVR
jgi:hypothetical protein